MANALNINPTTFPVNAMMETLTPIQKFVMNTTSVAITSNNHEEFYSFNFHPCDFIAVFSLATNIGSFDPISTNYPYVVKDIYSSIYYERIFTLDHYSAVSFYIKANDGRCRLYALSNTNISFVVTGALIMTFKFNV